MSFSGNPSPRDEPNIIKEPTPSPAKTEKPGDHATKPKDKSKESDKLKGDKASGAGGGA